jgi:hypothetical protein
MALRAGKKEPRIVKTVALSFPNGSPWIARNDIGNETKIAASTGATGDLLETITRKWSSGNSGEYGATRDEIRIASDFRSQELLRRMTILSDR